MPKAVDGMKHCNMCGETKPVSEYCKNKNNPDGLQYQCKGCRSTQDKQHYEKNKEKRREQCRQYHQEVLKTEPYVYIATDRSTGSFYIGRTTYTIEKRFKNHKNHKKKNPHPSSLGKYMNEYNLSLKDFEVEQHQCSSVEESIVLERKLIAENIDNPLCLNVRLW